MLRQGIEELSKRRRAKKTRLRQGGSLSQQEAQDLQDEKDVAQQIKQETQAGSGRKPREETHARRCGTPHNKFSLKSRNAYFSRFKSFNLQHNFLNMSRRRSPLAPISGNQRRGPDLSPYLRGKFVTLKECGVTTSAIAKRLSLPRSTIQSTLDLDELRNNGESQP